MKLTIFTLLLIENLQFMKAAQSCADLRCQGDTVDGIKTVHIKSGKAVWVFCDMTTDGGGWTVVQRRENASTSFNRSYSEYTVGFGDKLGNHWLGLEKMHLLTLQAQQLKVELTSCDDVTDYALYGQFQVGRASDGYRLSVDQFKGGSAGDSLNYIDKIIGYEGNYKHNGQKFTTYDKDQDGWTERNCVVDTETPGIGGGWWYDECFAAQINGPYPPNGKCSVNYHLNWYTWRGFDYSAIKTKMMIRPKNMTAHCEAVKSGIQPACRAYMQKKELK